MKPKRPVARGRREPKQNRARQTVDAILEAVVRILKRKGPAAMTTNHIAEVAGVSIGSVYQYFPDKRAIFVALHERHVQEIDRIIGSVLVKHAASSLDVLITAIVEAMIDAHVDEAHVSGPALYSMLFEEVPHRADGGREFAIRLHGAFRLAIASKAHELKKGLDLDKCVFIVTHMVEALCHGAVLRRPPGITLRDAKAETVRAVLAYLHA